MLRLSIIRVVLVGIGLCVCHPLAHADFIRVVAYNTFNNPDNVTEDAAFTTVFDAIANEVIVGRAKRPDVIAVSETDTDSSTRLVNLLNSLYGVTSYASVTSSSVGGDRTGVAYDTSTVSLQDFTDLTAGLTHPTVRTRLRPVGTGGEADFYVYAVHLKAGFDSGDMTIRATEATVLRADADALGEDANILYAGDFNLLGSSEGAWSNMTAMGNGQAFDTADAPGEWRENAAFTHLHTLDAGSNLDFRFDFQFVSDELLDGEGLDYVPGSFHVFGNNGTHTLGSPIYTGTGASPSVLSALMAASDHLPVVADYVIPEPSSFVIITVGGLVVFNRQRWMRRVAAGGCDEAQRVTG